MKITVVGLLIQPSGPGEVHTPFRYFAYWPDGALLPFPGTHIRATKGGKTEVDHIKAEVDHIEWTITEGRLAEAYIYLKPSRGD